MGEIVKREIIEAWEAFARALGLAVDERAELEPSDRAGFETMVGDAIESHPALNVSIRDLAVFLAGKVREASSSRVRDEHDATSTSAETSHDASSPREALATLAALHVSDLLLAFAVQADIPTAAEAFDHVLKSVAARVRASVRTDLSFEELVQELRVHLLVGGEPAGARLGQYGGRSSLAQWLRVVGTRWALNATRGVARELPFEHAFFLAQPELASAEARLVEARYGRSVREAVARGMTRLSERDQALLWFSLVDGQPAEQIAKIYGVHRTTASRWVERASADLRDAVENELAGDAGLAGSELSSIVRTILSRANSGA